MHDASPPAHYPWSAGFNSLEQEFDYRVTDVSGTVPDRLRGTLLRNGSGRNAIGETWFPHWFDGDGMISAVSFTGSGVYYRNRFVRTQNYLDETRAGKIMHRGFGKMRPGGIFANAFRLPANVANISVALQAGRLFALWEGGAPTELDPETLDTIGEERFGGRVGALCAHPRVDPQTGDLYAFGLDYGPSCTLTPYKLDRAGQMTRFEPIKLPYAVMNHDFVLTKRYLVFCLGPVVLSTMAMMLGLKSFDGALSWDASKPTLILAVPRDGAGKPVTIEAEPFFQFHFAGGFDDGDRVVLDAARYVDFNTIGQALRTYRTTPWPAEGMAVMTRISVDLGSGKVENRAYTTGAANEFPRIDPRRVASRYRYAYFLSTPGQNTQGLQQRVTRLDVESGDVGAHDFAPHGYPGEPVFIPYDPDNPNAPEDEGCVVVLVLDATSGLTSVVGLDAADIAAAPLFTAKLTHHVPLGLHGSFTPELFGKAKSAQ